MNAPSQQLEQGHDQEEVIQHGIEFSSEWVEKIGRPEFFTDQYDVEGARVSVRDHFETRRLKSKAYRNWLIRQYRRAGENINQSQIREMVTQREAFAKEVRRELSNRSAWDAQQQTLWIDQCNAGQEGPAGHRPLDCPGVRPYRRSPRR